jgi:hypothetical protein
LSGAFVALFLASCGGTGLSGSPVVSGAPAASTASRTPATATARPAAVSASPSVAQARIVDLDRLVAQLKAIHPNPFLDEGEASFTARVDAVKARAASLTDSGFLVAVMDLMGHRERDGHSGAWAFAQPNALLDAWPIWLWDFPDGLRVVAARAPYDDLIGGRVTRVGHLALDAARGAVEPLVPRDNESSLRANLPTYLVLPRALRERGVLSAGDPGLTLELLDGTTREVTPEPLPIEAYRDWIFGVYGGEYPTGLPPDEHGPPSLRHRAEAYWLEALRAPAAIYLGYNEVVRLTRDGRLLDKVVTTMADAAAAHPELPVVVDVRNNPGGDNNTYGSLRTALERIAQQRPGRVRLIAGRSTFSAAGNFVTDLMVGPQRAGIRLVGEPPGGGLDMYGDVKVVTLPNSRIVVMISARYHERAPGDDRLEIEPDIPATVSWTDYAAGRDPMLEAAARP